MPGVTDPAEEYFKDGLWGWVTSAWEKLVADASGFLKVNFAAQDVDVEVTQTTAADLTPGVCGWDGTVWRKLPMVWGFSSSYAEIETTNDAVLGTNDLTFSTVPDGEVWVIQAFVMRNIVSVCDMQFRVDHPDAGIMIIDYRAAAVIGDCYVCATTPFSLPKDGLLIARFLSCTAGDDLRSYAIGYKMKIAE